MKTAMCAVLWVLSAPVVFAWEFTPGTPCLLRHETPEMTVELTYNPVQPLYSISITGQVPFADAPTFAMQFRGSRPLDIATDRHQFSNEGRTVTVFDRGFGNVLNGLQFNQSASAILGTQIIDIPLQDASSAVAAFRACDVVPTT